MNSTKKLLEDALAGIPKADGQRRNHMGQFHGPKTTAPVIAVVLPELEFQAGPDDEPIGILDSLLLPGSASAGDGCEDGLGDF